MRTSAKAWEKTSMMCFENTKLFLCWSPGYTPLLKQQAYVRS